MTPDRAITRIAPLASQFAAAALRSGLHVPVHDLTQARQRPQFPRMSKGSLGISDRFTFLFAFDMRSGIERTNPVGLIHTFRAAFAPAEPVQLVIRVDNGRDDPGGWRRLSWEARQSRGVVLIDRLLSRDESLAMLDACDCYISLHCIEESALTTAQAMLMGKPVIATGYSGNMIFMTPDNSYPVDFYLSQDALGPPEPPATHSAMALLPDASRLMRRVYHDRDDARRRGERGRSDMTFQLSRRFAQAGRRGSCQKCQAPPGVTRTRHLIYHVYPRQDRREIWKWHMDQLRRAMPIFNGQRRITIALDDSTDSLENVRNYLATDGIEWIGLPNSKWGETEPFMFHLLPPLEHARGITFYAHAKGVTAAQHQVAYVLDWSERMYCSCLNQRAIDMLESHACAGAFRTTSYHLGSPWHYSGTFFWMRNDMVFRHPTHPWNAYDANRWAVEVYLGRRFSIAESACTYFDNPPDLYLNRV
jgi:hypothetical protein